MPWDHGFEFCLSHVRVTPLFVCCPVEVEPCCLSHRILKRTGQRKTQEDLLHLQIKVLRACGSIVVKALGTRH
jgi:hypothetical protein